VTVNQGQERSGLPKILVIVLVVGLIGTLLCAGVCGGGAFWGWGLFEEQAQQALSQNEVIVEHIGEIQSMEIDLMGTGDAADAGTPGGETFVFRIEGSKGSGVVTAEFVTNEADAELLTSGTLTLSNGEVIDLFAPGDMPDDN
jgi:hypothetical protein